MRASIAASILVVAGAAGAAVPPDFHQPALGAIADRMHTMAVEVVASGGGEKVEVASAHRLESAPLPSTFVGAPVFHARGALAGLLVNPSQHDGLLVPAARLREILARVRAAVPQVDDHTSEALR